MNIKKTPHFLDEENIMSIVNEIQKSGQKWLELNLKTCGPIKRKPVSEISIVSTAIELPYKCSTNEVNSALSSMLKEHTTKLMHLFELVEPAVLIFIDLPADYHDQIINNVSRRAGEIMNSDNGITARMALSQAIGLQLQLRKQIKEFTNATLISDGWVTSVQGRYNNN